MYKIIKNPLEELDKDLAVILKFIKQNSSRTSSKYEAITNLGMNFVTSTFDLELTLVEYIEKDNSKIKLVKFNFPIIYTDDYSIESAQVAYRLLKQYYSEAEDIVLSRLKESFATLNSELIMTDDLSSNFDKYYSNEEIQEIVAS